MRNRLEEAGGSAGGQHDRWQKTTQAGVTNQKPASEALLGLDPQFSILQLGRPHTQSLIVSIST